MLLQLISRAYAVSFPGIPLLDEQESLSAIIGDIVTWLLGFAGIIAVIYLIYGGLLYITSAGDAEKAKAGRNALINAIIGIVIIALAFLIVRWVGDIISRPDAGSAR